MIENEYTGALRALERLRARDPDAYSDAMDSLGAATLAVVVAPIEVEVDA